MGLGHDPMGFILSLKRLPAAAGLIASALVVWAACEPTAAEVIPVPTADAKGPPTLTMYWEGAESGGVLILIPGGDGQLNLKPRQVSIDNQFYQTLKQLDQGADPRHFDVVLFDSPDRLDPNPKGYPSSRAAAEHLSRIHSVIEFYKAKTGKPVWLMGHSNGAVSVTEYLRYLAKNGADTQIAGLILSSARNVAYFDAAPLHLPVLFMSHRKDGCADSNPNVSLGNFRQVQGRNTARTAFVFIETGEAEAKSPCESGYHMYNRATEEAVTALRGFIAPR